MKQGLDRSAIREVTETIHKEPILVIKLWLFANTRCIPSIAQIW